VQCTNYCNQLYTRSTHLTAKAKSSATDTAIEVAFSPFANYQQLMFDNTEKLIALQLKNIMALTKMTGGVTTDETIVNDDIKAAAAVLVPPRH
jgi:hypothetical protein